MKKITLKKLIANSNIPASLIRSTIKQCGGWSEFIEKAEDVANHGASGGSFGGFVYYVDTCAFFKRNKKYILAMAENTFSDLGYNSVIEMFADFNDSRRNKWTHNEIINAIYSNKGDEKDQIQNLMTWYALEEVCRAYVDRIEE